MLKTLTIPTRTASAQRGLSLVELLVGVALGLFLVAGAATLFVNHLGNSRRLLLEARLNQDLRAAADLVTRDLRRAGYWGGNNSLQGTTKIGSATSTTPNPYAAVSPGVGTITYDFSRDAIENNTRDANERFAFDLSGGAIRMTINGAAQVVTDPDTVTITGFTVTPTVAPVNLGDACAAPFRNIANPTVVEPCCDALLLAAGLCAAGQVVNWTGTNACPIITVRQYLVTITGRATRDATVTRTLQTRVRVRNDAFAGVCPA